MHLVNNEKTAELLNRTGFEAIATGMPIIYSENFKPNEKKVLIDFLCLHILLEQKIFMKE